MKICRENWLGRVRPLLTGRLPKIMLGLLAAWLLLLALGLWAVPPVLRSVLASQLGKALGRDVTIAAVSVNPLALSVQVDGLSVKDRAGAEQLGFAQLHIDVSSLSVAQAGWVLDEIRLHKPRVAITRLADGRYDISDWLDRLGGNSSSSGALPRFSLNNIQITEGEVVFDDRPLGVRHVANAVNFSLPFVSSLPYKAEVWVQPAFSAVVDGAHVALQGRSQPFAKSHTSALTLKLDKLDLAKLQPYLPSGLPVRLKAGQLSSHLSLEFAELADGAPSLGLSGTAQLDSLDLTDAQGQPWLGLASMALTLDKSQALLQQWQLAELSLQGLRLGPDTTDAPLRVQQLLAKQLVVDVPKRHLGAELVQGTGLMARMTRAADGSLVWLALPTASAPAVKTQPDAAASQAAWTGVLERLSLDEVGFRFEDRSVSPTAVQELAHASLVVDRFDISPGQSNNFKLAAQVNQSGKLKASGSLQLQPLNARLLLETEALPVVPVQAYVAPFLNTTIVQGVFSSQGTVDIQQPQDKLLASYTGSLTLGQFRAVDQANNTDFLRWKSLYVGGVDFQLLPARLGIGEIALSDFYSRLILNAQGQLNLGDVVRSPASSSKPATADSAPMPLQIAKVTLQNGRVDFSDHFVKPHYSATVTHLGGRIQGLSSAPDTLADLDLRGSYASNAPVHIAARFNPLADKKFLDLQAKVSDIDLVDFSPYSGKFAGYSIRKGKLSLDASYKLQDRQLSAQNRLFIDQLTFGDKVDSPDATQLPVQLAISLLKNNRGQIDVQLPIAGSLDDPQFSVGGLIFKVIGNLFSKAVSSPFALLGSWFGDSQELSQLDFAPGRATLDEVAVQKLQTLAKAMRERDALTLEITASSDTATDPEALRQVALERAVMRELRKDQPPTPSPNTTLAELRLDSNQYTKYLTRAFELAKFPKPRNLVGQAKALPVDEMEKLMLANLPVGEEDLRALAARRAQVVQAWLVDQGQVPLGRIFLLPNKVGADGAAPSGQNRVSFSLR